MRRRPQHHETHARGPGFVPRGSFRSRRGLTLLEVLLATAILLLSLVAITRLIDFGTDRAIESNFQAAATRLAYSKLAEAEAGVISLTSESSGTFEDQNEPEWSWTISPAREEGVANLYAVTVKVSRDFKGRPFEVEFKQFLVDPSKLGTAAQAEKPTESTGTEDPATTSGSGTTTSGTTGGTTP